MKKKNSGKCLLARSCYVADGTVLLLLKNTRWQRWNVPAFSSISDGMLNLMLRLPSLLLLIKIRWIVLWGLLWVVLPTI